MGFRTLGRLFDNNIHDVIDDQIDVVSCGFSPDGAVLAATITSSTQFPRRIIIRFMGYSQIVGTIRKTASRQNH